MKHLKLYEEYSDSIGFAMKGVKKFMGGKFIKWMNKWGSVIDNLLHLDLKAIKLEFNNRETFEKISKILNEIVSLKRIYTMSDNKNIAVEFEDLYKYGIDPYLIDRLRDDDVMEYLLTDKKLIPRIQKYEEFIKIFEEYSDWYKENIDDGNGSYLEDN